MKILSIKSGIGFTGHPSDTLVNVQTTARQFARACAQPLVAGGEEGARRQLLNELREHVQTSCPEFTHGQIEEQVRLLANAIFVRAYHPKSFRAYMPHEATT